MSTLSALQNAYLSRFNYGKNDISVSWWRCQSCQSSFNRNGQAIHFTKCPDKQRLQTIFDEQSQKLLSNPGITKPIALLPSKEETQPIAEAVATNEFSCEYFLGMNPR